MAIFTDLFSRRTLCSVLFNNFIKFSASPLALGCSDVIRSCLKPSSCAKSTIFFQLNVGSLSLSILSSVPYVANTFFNFSFVDFIAVQYTISTSGYLVRFFFNYHQVVMFIRIWSSKVDRNHLLRFFWYLCHL